MLDYVATHGDNFNKMPKEILPERSLIQIKNHYNCALKHKGQINQWTREEDQKLMEFVEKEGPNWSKLASLLKTHNRLSCRTRHQTITKFLLKNPNKTIEDVPTRLKSTTSIHKAIDEVDDDKNDEEKEIEGKVIRSKAFGLLTFEEFRSKNTDLYHLLKTTYNYDLGAREISIDDEKFLILKSLLNVNSNVMQGKAVLKPHQAFSQNQLLAIQHALSMKLDEKVSREIQLFKQNRNFLMPPNLNSAIGLRALSIKMQEDPVIGTIEEKSRSEKFKQELEKFEKLFHTLFYWTAMASRMNETALRESFSRRSLIPTILKPRIQVLGEKDFSDAEPQKKKIKLS